MRERLGLRTDYIIRQFEKRGWLTPVRLSGRPAGDVFYDAAEVQALPDRVREWETAHDGEAANG